MSSRWCLLCLLGALVAANAGCAQLDSLRSYLTDNDYRDGTEEYSDTWTSIAGTEGRGDKLRETDPDPWWSFGVQSAKARDIERNLGIDH